MKQLSFTTNGFIISKKSLLLLGLKFDLKYGCHNPLPLPNPTQRFCSPAKYTGDHILSTVYQ